MEMTKKTKRELAESLERIKAYKEGLQKEAAYLEEYLDVLENKRSDKRLKVQREIAVDAITRTKAYLEDSVDGLFLAVDTLDKVV